MIGIVIVAHGGLAGEYLRAIEHVVGPQKGAVAISIGAECDRAERQEVIRQAVDEVDSGNGVVGALATALGGCSALSSSRMTRSVGGFGQGGGE